MKLVIGIVRPENAIDSAEIERVGGQSVKSVGGHAQHLPSLNLFADILDQRRFWLLGVNFQDFRAHSVPFLMVGVNSAMYHTTAWLLKRNRFHLKARIILILEPTHEAGREIRRR